MLEECCRVRLAEHLLQQPELERRLTRRCAIGDRSQQHFRLRILSARDQRSRFERGNGRIVIVELVCECLDLRVAAFHVGAGRGLQRRLCLGAAGHLRVAARGKRDACDEGERRRKGQAARVHRGSYYI